ncbi:hypothetical protein CK203_117713 [Vitis vinifera]|uniref:Uncharacterized protein n=1 Tax=Vitis vinifera TaxID=29760 RepID=A0A438BND2_VITVI|nr:hypothetical protein CK203_117713 [Vitis vinifera]
MYVLMYVRNAQVLDEELNLLLLVFLGCYSILGIIKEAGRWIWYDNVAVVNGRGKITRSCDDNMGLDLQFIHNNIARVLHDFLNNCYGLEMNQTNDFKLLIDVLRDP